MGTKQAKAATDLPKASVDNTPITDDSDDSCWFYVEADDEGILNGFSYHIAQALLMEPDPANYNEAMKSSNWTEWQEAIQSELPSQRR